MQKMRVSGRREIAMDCKCRGDEGRWEKSKIAVDYKFRGNEGQWGRSKITVDCK